MIAVTRSLASADGLTVSRTTAKRLPSGDQTGWVSCPPGSNSSGVGEDDVATTSHIPLVRPPKCSNKTRPLRLAVGLTAAVTSVVGKVVVGRTGATWTLAAPPVTWPLQN